MLKMGDKFWPSGDSYGRYEAGMARLMLSTVAQQKSAELAPIFIELQNVLNKSRKSGDTPARRNDRHQLVMLLNVFCIANGIGTYNDLCSKPLTAAEENALVDLILSKGNPLQLSAGG